MSLKERLTQLSYMTGQALGPEETTVLKILEGQIKNLEQELQSKSNMSSFLDGQLEEANAQLRAQEKLNHDYLVNIHKEIDRFGEGQKVLQTFIEYIESDEFEVNSLRADVSEQSQQFWRDLKQYHDKGTELSSELEELKELRAKCIELRERTEYKKNSQ